MIYINDVSKTDNIISRLRTQNRCHLFLQSPFWKRTPPFAIELRQNELDLGNGLIH
jgi:hypothetical protein